MVVREDHKNLRIGLVVHSTVKQLNRVGGLLRRGHHALASKGVIAHQHPTKVHILLTILIGLGVGVLRRVLSIDSKVCPVTITSS